MKTVFLSLVLLLGAASAFAKNLSVTVCSVDRQDQVSHIEIRIDGPSATLSVDGYPLQYEVLSETPVRNLRAATPLEGDKLVEATEYVLSAPQGTDTIQIGKTVFGANVLIFPENRILGATSADCD